MSTRLSSRLRVLSHAAWLAATLLVAVPLHAIAADSQITEAAEKKLSTRLDEGYVLMKRGDFNGALAAADDVIAGYEAMRGKAETLYFCATTLEEVVLYPVYGSALDKPTIVLGPSWCDAHFLRGYVLVELQRVDEARKALDRAVGMAPQNPHYLSELGHVIGMQGDWPGSLEAFERAADAAEGIAPEQLRAKELSRAWRGMGYAYIEMGKLDEAEAMYLKCLKVDSTDKVAANELEYVRGLREKAKSGSKD